MDVPYHLAVLLWRLTGTVQTFGRDSRHTSLDEKQLQFKYILYTVVYVGFGTVDSTWHRCFHQTKFM